jgi:subtilisin family serine protease
VGSIPDDPKFGEQWGLRNLGIGVLGYPAKLNADIRAIDAWAITSGSPDVIVALTDTGVDITHPDLADNIYRNTNEIPDNQIDDDNNGYVDDVNGYNVADRNGDVSDVTGHGTQMAGIIAAKTNNAAGVSGVTQSKILPVRFFTRTSPDPIDFNATVADAAKALLYSVAAGAKIINASWRTLLTPGQVTNGEAGALSDAVNATLEAGALLVCIAGNEGFDNDHIRIYPGAYQLSNQIVVGASEFNDEIWHPPFEPTIIKSGFGRSSVHLMAPGVSVLTTLARGSCVTCTDSPNPADWYGYVDGTSASAAFVSGVAALVKSIHPDDYATVIKRRILDGVDVRGELEPFVVTGGRLSAYGALTAESSVSPPVLNQIKYKPGNLKLFLYGENIQRGAIALVDGVRYKLKLKGGEPQKVLANKVPNSALPVGVEVPISIVNPDGGQSLTLTLTR